MKKLLLILLLLTSWQGMSAQKQKSDPIRNKLSWMAPAAPSNNEGDIEAMYLGYTTPDGQEHHIVCQLPWPMPADMFTGGDVTEEDVNFDGIPDMQVSLGYADASGSNYMYAWYVWDSKRHVFKEVVVDDLLINPEADKKGKVVRTRQVVDGTHFLNKMYKWKDNSLVITKSWTEEF